jgi:hypothetical protein
MAATTTTRTHHSSHLGHILILPSSSITSQPPSTAVSPHRLAPSHVHIHCSACSAPSTSRQPRSRLFSHRPPSRTPSMIKFILVQVSKLLISRMSVQLTIARRTGKVRRASQNGMRRMTTTRR